MDLYWGGPERRISPLTVRIIGINFAALLMLLIGIVYLGQYQNTLIESSLNTFKSEVEIISASLAEAVTDGNDDMTGPLNYATAKRMIWRYSHMMGQHIYLFDRNGHLVADSDNLPGYGDVHKWRAPEDTSLNAVQILKSMAKFVLELLPARKSLPAYPQSENMHASDYESASDALKGAVSISAWSKDDEILLVAGAPLMQKNQIIGAVMLTREGRDIAQNIGDVWLNIITAFFITLILTTLLSIYLSNVITNPLRKLANAAETLRRGKSKDTEIPDLSERKDEIGELSIVLREMTQALWDRMDSIERFAADVAHELKNPLTSLRSAVETAAIVKKDQDRQKLMEIIKDDVERMDRLITDISNASRLDSELSREALEPIDLKSVLHDLLATYQDPIVRAEKETPNDDRIVINIPLDKDIFVWGLKGRILQVLDNVVANALSFSPATSSVMIHIAQARKTVTVTIEDQGPGIPENRLETIFERFYTERPQHEAYGKHSGLGLSICRQIMDALGGRIYAENVYGRDNKVIGARFTIILNAV